MSMQPDRNHPQAMWPMPTMQPCGASNHFRPQHYIENLLHDHRWPKHSTSQTHWPPRLHHEGQHYGQDMMQSQSHSIGGCPPSSQCFVQQGHTKNTKSHQNADKFLSIASLAQPAASSYVPPLLNPQNADSNNPFMNNWNVTTSVTNSAPLPSMFNFLPLQNVQNDDVIPPPFTLSADKNDPKFCSPTKTSEANSRINEIANELRNITSFPCISPQSLSDCEVTKSAQPPSHSVSKLIDEAVKQKETIVKSSTFQTVPYQNRPLSHVSCSKPNQQRRQEKNQLIHEAVPAPPPPPPPPTSASAPAPAPAPAPPPPPQSYTVPLSHRSMPVSTRTSTEVTSSTSTTKTLLQTIASSNLSLNLCSKQSLPLSHVPKTCSQSVVTTSSAQVPTTITPKTLITTTTVQIPQVQVTSTTTAQPKPASVVSVTPSHNVQTTKITTDKNVEEASVLPVEYMCDFCNATFKRESALVAHLRTHDSPPTPATSSAQKTGRHVCNVCQQTFSRKDVMTRHARRHREDYKRDECEECGATFTERRSLLRHQARAHSIDAQHICKDCNARFKMPKQLATHMAAKHGDSNAICKSDGKHECSQCNKFFKSPHHLTAHQRVHTGERPFKCADSDCNKTYKSHYALTQHIAAVHAHEKPFKCPYSQCNASFSAKSSLSYHVSTHTNDRNHICFECGQAFIMASDLRKHQRIHSGDRPHACDQCPAKFKLTSHLAAHKRLHNGKSVVVKTTSKGVTTTTSNKSSATSPKCDRCGEICANRGHLAVHMRREHNSAI
ncbi:unnamed protein product [Dimorphilus gyrociliatus]|uniref:C2H2-type domain-containing protein n=1 Tax=Dimorphilus gyrociliatus TaxID=2664684 RepID=A0A7I8W4G8_9ANNE|nr:unnamed protein product [Dimorphilus gyrociliatus]